MDAATVINDYAKGVVTLGSALLVFTGASLDLAKPISPWIVICWALLVLTIAAGMFAAGRLAAALRTVAAEAGSVPKLSAAARFANVAMGLFLAATLAFIAHSLTMRAAPVSVRPLHAAATVLHQSEPRNTRLTLRSAHYVDKQDVWRLSYVTDTHVVVLLLRGRDNALISYERAELKP